MFPVFALNLEFFLCTLSGLGLVAHLYICIKASVKETIALNMAPHVTEQLAKGQMETQCREVLADYIRKLKLVNRLIIS